MKQANLTASEEDYIEMIYRLAQPNKIEIRVNELATSLIFCDQDDKKIE